MVLILLLLNFHFAFFFFVLLLAVIAFFVLSCRFSSCCRRGRWLPDWNHEIWRKFVLAADECFSRHWLWRCSLGRLGDFEAATNVLSAKHCKSRPGPTYASRNPGQGVGSIWLVHSPNIRVTFYENLGMPAKVQIGLGLKGGTLSRIQLLKNGFTIFMTVFLDIGQIRFNQSADRHVWCFPPGASDVFGGGPQGSAA